MLTNLTVKLLLTVLSLNYLPYVCSPYSHLHCDTDRVEPVDDVELAEIFELIDRTLSN